MNKKINISMKDRAHARPCKKAFALDYDEVMGKVNGPPKPKPKPIKRKRK